MTEIKEVESLYANLIKDKDYQRYQLLAENPNFFEILRAQSYEIRHSNFLAWLLDPQENHGLGDQILKSFLTDLSIDDKSNDFSVLSIQNLDFNNVNVLREWNHIDIVLVFEDHVIAIENKINHIETEGQLNKYKNLIDNSFKVKHKVFVFLNPYGHDPSNENYISYSYETLLDYMEQVLELNQALLPRTKVYLEDYVNNMKNNIMGTGKKSEIANKIYRNHRELFEFVFENKSNMIFEVKTLLQSKIEEEGWILSNGSKPYLRFLTPELDAIMPKGVVKGWKTGEAFLFEIYFYANQNTIYTYCTLGPCGEPMRNDFLNYLKPIQTSTKAAKAWSNYRNKTFSLQKYNDLRLEEDKDDLIKDIWKAIQKLVNEVEPLLLKHKEEIMDYKQKAENG